MTEPPTSIININYACILTVYLYPLLKNLAKIKKECKASIKIKLFEIRFHINIPDFCTLSKNISFVKLISFFNRKNGQSN